MNELLAYDSIEPIGNERLIAILKIGFATLANALFDTEGEPIEPDDFDPVAERKPPPIASPRATKAFLEMAFPGKVL